MKIKLLFCIIVATIITTIFFNKSFKANNYSELELKYLLTGDIAAYTHEGYWYQGDSCCSSYEDYSYDILFTKKNNVWTWSYQRSNNPNFPSNQSSSTNFAVVHYSCEQRRCLPYPRIMKGSYCFNDCWEKCLEEVQSKISMFLCSL